MRLAGGGTENFVVTPRALEIDRVTFTGAGVAAVVAETKEAAEDALELIEIDWEPLAASSSTSSARSPTARRRSTRTAPSNVVMDWSCGDADATDAGARRLATSSSSSGSSTSG